MHAYRTHTCNDLRTANVGSEVKLSGRVHRVRDHGGVPQSGIAVYVLQDCYDEFEQPSVCVIGQAVTDAAGAYRIGSLGIGLWLPQIIKQLGLETSLVGTFEFRVRKDMKLKWPRAETPTHFITMGFDPDINKAMRIAVEEAVVERRIDLGLAVNPRPHPSLTIVRLFEDAMDLFVEASMAPVATNADDETSLARATEMLRRGPLVYAGRIVQCQILADRLANAHMLPDRTLSCGDLELVKSLALAGVGVAMLPRRVAAYGQEGKLLRLHPRLPFIPDVISLIYRADMHRTRAAMRLKDALVAYGKTLAE